MSAGAALDLEGLNPVQRAAVLHDEGPLLLLAGAGSGKTRVVTHRIARLLIEGAAPDSVLALTFTNRAAREMRERVFALLGAEDLPGLTISTFHSLGARFLRQHATAVGRTRAFTIYDDDDQTAVLREALNDLNAGLTAKGVRAWRRAIDQAKNAGLDAREATAPAEGGFLDPAEVGARYELLMERADAFDFGDLILRPAQILTEVPSLAERYRRQWRWVLVDEFQDTNRAQYAWLRTFAPPDSNLFVVGDDDQSIYGWRGAEVENILQFPHEYPAARVVRLEQNYRSDGHILRAANGVIAHNDRRLGKDLWTERGEGTRIELYEGHDARGEARWVAERIAGLCRDEGHAPGDVAVLMRANHLSLDLEETLTRAGLRYAVVRGRSFYDRAEVRDALAYVRLLVNPNDDVAFRRAVGVPARGVGKTSLARLAAFADERGLSTLAAAPAALEAAALRGRARTGLAELLEALAVADADDARPSARVRGLLERAGVTEHLASADVERGAGEGRQANVERLLQAIESYEQETPDASLAGYLEQVKLVSEVDVAQLSGGAVSLMTVHAAKGLEFPVVFVIGLEDGVFPNARALDDLDGAGEEEERRLCYVALTRAERRLILTRARQRRTFGDVRHNAPSRFLRELPRDVVESRYVPEPPPTQRGWPRRAAGWPREHDPVAVAPAPSDDELCMDAVYDDFGGADGPGFRPGMRVWHAQLGAGRVRRINPGMRPSLTIDFDDVGQRKVLASFVAPYQG